MNVTFPVSETQSTQIQSRARREWTPHHATIPTSRYVILALSLIALTVSAYLAYVGLTASKVAGCGGSVFNCDHVLSTKWSLWMGIPVGVLATGLYASMLAAITVSIFARSSLMHQLGLSVMTIAGLSAGAGALWFIGLQVFAIGHLCLWCLVAHSCGLLIAATLIYSKPLGRRLPVMPTLAGLMGVATLIGGQALAEPPPTYEVQTFPMAEAVPVEQISSPGSDTADTTETNATESTTAEPDVFGAPVFDAPVFGAPVFEAPASETEDAELLENPDVTSTLNDSDRFALASTPPFMIALLLSMFLQALCGGSAFAADEEGKQAGDQQPEPKKTVLFGGGIRLNRGDWPATGSPDAKYAFVEMFDYTCPHCRETHLHCIKKLKAKYGKELSIITLPVPLNSKCNSAVQSTSAQAHNACELAKLAVAVWLTNREKFSEFHDWMFESSSPRDLTAARQHAEKLVDKDRLSSVLSQNVCDAYIKRHVQLYQKVGSGAVPKLLLEKTALVGKVSSPDHISSVLEQQFGRE